MTNKEIDEEIEKLQSLKKVNNAKTKDGFDIIMGETYYALRNLSIGFEEVIITEDYHFHEWGIDKSKYSKQFYSYDNLFKTKDNAKQYMRKYLENAISSNEHTIKNYKTSLEMLNKLEVK